MLRKLAVVGALFTATAAFAQNTSPFKIGVITDMSGMNSGVTGTPAFLAVARAMFLSPIALIA